MTPNGYIVVYNDKRQFLWELSIVPEGIGRKNDIYGGLAINKDSSQLLHHLENSC